MKNIKTNKDWLIEQIKILQPEEIYDLLMDVIDIGTRYNNSRSGIANWLMQERNNE